jgi:hypothetical protein
MKDGIKIAGAKKETRQKDLLNGLKEKNKMKLKFETEEIKKLTKRNGFGELMIVRDLKEIFDSIKHDVHHKPHIVWQIRKKDQFNGHPYFRFAWFLTNLEIDPSVFKLQIFRWTIFITKGNILFGKDISDVY